MKLKYINYGTGNRVGNTIYLNKNLKKYPKLHDAILTHEKKHTGRFSMFDLKLDFDNKELANVKNEWLRFIFKYPRTWINFFPIMKLGNNWCVDLSLTFLWLFFIILFSIGWWVL